MENVTKLFQIGKKLYIKEDLYEVILDHCKNWWGKEKLTDLWKKNVYKSYKKAEKEDNKFLEKKKKKYDTDILVDYNILQDRDSGKFFIVFEWSAFQKKYGNGTYVFELSDYGHFQV